MSPTFVASQEVESFYQTVVIPAFCMLHPDLEKNVPIISRLTTTPFNNFCLLFLQVNFHGYTAASLQPASWPAMHRNCCSGARRAPIPNFHLTIQSCAHCSIPPSVAAMSLDKETQFSSKQTRPWRSFCSRYRLYQSESDDESESLDNDPYHRAVTPCSPSYSWNTDQTYNLLYESMELAFEMYF